MANTSFREAGQHGAFVGLGDGERSAAVHGAREHWVRSVAVTPDGKYVVSGSGDKTVRLWELATGQEVRRFTGHEMGVMSVAVTPDGKYVVSGSGDKTVRVWYIGDLRKQAR
jgi:WD40 repeat protein